MSSAVVFVLVCCMNAKKTLHKARLTALHAIWLHELYSVFFPKAIPHKERLATLHAICLQISRHISPKCS